MKGIATITLTDAKTGRIVRQTTEENLVTNAMKNILNPTLYAMMHGLDYSKLISGCLPMWKNLCSGVLLLGNNVTEDADNILLPDDTYVIGNAASPYSGTDTMRGTLNENESYQTENGYHFTWDFGTDKANGTIRCIGLTSRQMGDTGFFAQNSSLRGFLLNPVSLSGNGQISQLKFEYGAGQYLGTFEQRTHLFSDSDADGNLIFRKYRSIDPTALRLNDATGFSSVSVPISTKVLSPTIKIDFDTYCFVNPETMLIYYFSPATKLDAQSMQIDVMAVDIATLEVASTHSFVINKSYSVVYGGAVFRDRLYLMTISGLEEFTLEGAHIAEYSCAFNNNSMMFVHGGWLMASGSSQKIYGICGGRQYVFSMNNAYTLFNNQDLKPPYAAAHLVTYHRAGAASIYSAPLLVIAGGYLATINNLSQPLTKTSDQTLKISYDICS